MDGRVLHFHLAGINNQNFIMRDEETGSWWQQVTGEAVLGPLKGTRLAPVLHDELTFGLWRREQADGRVLRPDTHVPASRYAPADWEERMQGVPVATNDRVMTVEVGNESVAYPIRLMAYHHLVQDTVGGTPLVATY